MMMHLPHRLFLSRLGNTVWCGVATRRAVRARLGLAAAVWAMAGSLVMAAASDSPSPSDAMGAYRAAATAVSAWSTEPTGFKPGMGEEPPAGCFVQVRMEGVLVGTGSAVSLTPRKDEESVVDRAVRQALSRAEEHTPIARDAMRQERLRELAQRVMLSVELAGPLTPVEPASLEDLDRLLSPGVDGVAVGVGMKLLAISPGVMLSRGLVPSTAARSLVSEVTGDAAMSLDDVKELRDLGVRLYRFRTTHLAQPTVGHEPVFLHRGARLVETTDLDSVAEVRAFADLLAAGLLARYTAAESARQAPAFREGVLAITSGEFENGLSDRSGAMLAALALRRYGEIKGEEAVMGPRRKSARDAADALVHFATDGGASPGSASAGALAVLARAPGADAGQPPFVGVLLALSEEPRPSAPAVGGLWALALYESPTHRKVAEARVTEMLGVMSIESLPGAMPWLGLAQIRMGEGAADVPGAVALRGVRELAWSKALSVAQTGPAGDDLVGGIVLDAGGPPMPTWQTARLAVVFAAMLRDERVTPKSERGREIVRLLGALRFLRQMTVDADSAWLCPEPASALGSVRMAPWEARSSVDATAITLLAVCEAVESLEAMKQATR